MRWIRAIGALLVLALLVVGVPVMLITAVGNPWPETGINLNDTLSDEAILGALAAVAWFLWAQMLVCIWVEVVGAIRNGEVDVQAPGVFSLQQQLARVLITSVVLAIGSGTVIGLHPDTAVAAPPAAFLPPTAVTTGAAETDIDDQATIDQVEADTETLTVRRGDTLWGLAEKHLGDGAKFDQIAKLNEGQAMTGGQVFHSSEAISVGWELRMPAGSTTTSASHDEQTEVRVQPGDSLSKIAQDEYGDGTEWPKIWKANQGKRFDDGRTFSDPDLIQPGWKLDVPESIAAADAGQLAKPVDSQRDSEQAPRERSHADGRVDLSSTSPRVVERRIQRQIALDATADRRDSAHVSTTDENDEQLPGWIMPGLMGAGTLLAGSLLLVLRSRRANQHRIRRPGRTIPATGPELAAVEKSITVAGDTTTTTVELVETLLRRLAASLAERSQALPAVAAIEVTGSAVAIHLRTPTTGPGEPWAVADDGLLWVVDKEVDPDLVGVDQADSPAPWPLLVTIGHDDHGGTWLLNLEDLTVNVTGDRVAAGDFARFVAAEVACNPWSRHTALDVVGIAGEVAAMSPERIHVRDTSMAPAAQAVADAVHTVDRLTDDLSRVSRTPMLERESLRVRSLECLQQNLRSSVVERSSLRGLVRSRWLRSRRTWGSVSLVCAGGWPKPRSRTVSVLV